VGLFYNAPEPTRLYMYAKVNFSIYKLINLRSCGYSDSVSKKNPKWNIGNGFLSAPSCSNVAFCCAYVMSPQFTYSQQVASPTAAASARRRLPTTRRDVISASAARVARPHRTSAAWPVVDALQLFSVARQQRTWRRQRRLSVLLAVTWPAAPHTSPHLRQLTNSTVYSFP